MVMISNLQYGWTYFVDPIDARYHWGRASIQVAFTVFVATETWLVPIEGWFVDRFGPRMVVMFGGIVVALAWTLNSFASSLPMLYLAAAIGGFGAGAVYGTCVGNALKWFADCRGLAAGLTAAGFGAGAAATVVPIIYVIRTYGYDRAFLWFGLGQGVVVLVLSQMLKAPKPGDAPPAKPRKVSQSLRDYQPMEMLRTPLFWLLYVMFVLVAASGLVVTAQVAPIARDYKIASLPVNLFFISSTVLVMAGIIDNVLNGLARPTFGWVSDHIGRENTMAIVFTCGAGAYWALGTIGNYAVDVHRNGGNASTSPGAKSTASFPRSAPTCTARSTRRRMPVCCTRRRARRRSSFRWRAWCKSRRGAGMVCSSLRPWRTSPSRRLRCSSSSRCARRACRKRRGSPFRRRRSRATA